MNERMHRPDAEPTRREGPSQSIISISNGVRAAALIILGLTTVDCHTRPPRDNRPPTQEEANTAKKAIAGTVLAEILIALGVYGYVKWPKKREEKRSDKGIKGGQQVSS